mgnify:CR=1 FL=1
MKIYDAPLTFSNAHWNNVIDTEPTSEPIANSVMKNFLKVDTSADDDLIASMITTARQIVEQRARVQLLSATYKMNLDRFPIQTNWITLPISPLSSVTHIKYYDDTNTQQTWAASNYIVDDQSEPPRIRIAQSSTFPSTYARPNAVEIKYVAGYASTSAVGYPTALNAAIYLIVGHLYENRQDVVNRIQYVMPQGAQTIIDNFKILTV